jgi:hypothetical protein
MELNQRYEDLKRSIEVKNHKSEVLMNILSDKEALYDSTSVRPNNSEIKKD